MGCVFIPAQGEYNDHKTKTTLFGIFVMRLILKRHDILRHNSVMKLSFGQQWCHIISTKTLLSFTTYWCARHHNAPAFWAPISILFYCNLLIRTPTLVLVKSSINLAKMQTFWTVDPSANKTFSSDEIIHLSYMWQTMNKRTW